MVFTRFSIDSLTHRDTRLQKASGTVLTWHETHIMPFSPRHTLDIKATADDAARLAEQGKVDIDNNTDDIHVSVAKWANTLSEPQYLLGLSGWRPQRPGIKSGSRHELSVGWTNGRYAMRLISRTGTEVPPVSSLNCDRCRL